MESINYEVPFNLKLSRPAARGNDCTDRSSRHAAQASIPSEEIGLSSHTSASFEFFKYTC